MDINRLLKQLKKGQILTEKQLRTVAEKAKDLFMEESNVQPVNSPVNVCGDIHGQFYDLLKLFEMGGQIPDANYIFIGDFVDRGGNHESRTATRSYGFYDECLNKYGNPNAWLICVDLFDHLPIAASIDGQILCLHGGLSPEIKTIDQMRVIDRVREVPVEGAFCDLLWSDPADIETWVLSDRGAGWNFGGKVTKEFNHLNGLDLICRAHQLVLKGYQYWFEEKNLVTVWSAPNYCYKAGNVASILKFDENLNREIVLFKESDNKDNKESRSRRGLPYFL